MMPFSAVRSSNVMVRTWMKQRPNDFGKALGFRLARCGVESGFSARFCFLRQCAALAFRPSRKIYQQLLAKGICSFLRPI